MGKNLKEIQKKITPILKKNDVKKSSVFGSVARGEEKVTSDLDLLVEFKGEKTLLDLVALKMEIEKMLKRKVDILTFKSVSPLLKKIIAKDSVKIYG